MHSSDKFLSFLGLARRAGKLTLGFDAAATSIHKKESRMILTAADISPKTLKEISYALRESTLEPVSVPYTMQEIKSAVGKEVRIISVNDRGFAENLSRLLSTAKGEETV